MGTPSKPHPPPALESRGFLSPTKDSETLKPTHSRGDFCVCYHLSRDLFHNPISSF